MSRAESYSSSEADLLDRGDSRLAQAHGVSGQIKKLVEQIKSGDLGSSTVILGLILIWGIFTYINPIFLSPNNLINLLFDGSTVGIISLGIVCVLMLGEIDLSVGSMSGVGSTLLGLFWVSKGLPLGIAIAISLCFGALVGLVYATLRNVFGMPSFVSTLAGLLALLGLQLYLLGANGSINLPYGSSMVGFGQLLVIPNWLSYVFCLLTGMIVASFELSISHKRLRAQLSAKKKHYILMKAVILTVVLLAVAAYLNRGRGIPWMFGLFVFLIISLDYALRRTKWGRCVLAVGGNAEAARRAGINVKAVYVSAFMACSTLASLGGVLAASRLATASRQAGAGDVNLNAIAAAVIGGTSLFGGRGSAWSALLGIIVIQSISSGLTLLNLTSAHRYMITGAVLAIAVIIDSLARRSRVSHGRA